MLKKLLALFCLSVTLSSGATADVLLSQTPNTLVYFGISDSATTRRAAENINLVSGDFINRVSWQGWYSNGVSSSHFLTPSASDNFTLNFYADATVDPSTNSGTMGSLLASINVGTANRTNAPLWSSGSIFSYTADLGSDITLGNGRFWLSIVNDTSATENSDWNWFAFGPTFQVQPPADGAISNNGGLTYSFLDLTYYLVLEGGNRTVPEPSPLALIALAMLAGVWTRRKVAQG